MANPSLVMTTELGRCEGRVIVVCSIEHLIPSCMSVDDLFARLRTDLFKAATEAVTHDASPVEFHTTTRVGMDVGESDPEVILTIFNPHRFLADFDGYVEWMHRLATRFVAAAHLDEVQL